jgi:hypothetical protein
MKVTATKCLDGKRHKWKDIHISSRYGEASYTSWCERCGSLTEFYKNDRMKKRARCSDAEEKTYIEIPECFNSDHGNLFW